MAYNTNLHSSHNPSTPGWDLHSLGVFNTDMSLIMETSTPFLPLADFSSTGYLQDALMEWNDRCKRRRLQLYDNDQDQRTSLENLIQNYWSSNWTGETLKNFNCPSKITEASGISGEPFNSSISSISDGENIFSEIKTIEDYSVSGPETYNSLSCMQDRETQISSDPVSASESGLKRKKKVITGVVYPFALVKPGGVDGDMTLNDINERILMPPTRPVKHPVGDFAGRPCVSPDGPGLSGKAVVALTKIQTQGRGTITIIRTRG
ncbi:uncharacterized protein LOC122646315 isoform X2 [Telopea speciosissima]|uniref:uncharacterized protein LOC122646315 isoform X2 n=1 Tax=Telopea speciosissima TaxID=54955 RepID=UPI001CC371F5|nr:uncharacterized protein LOC122646315 isoform X2 [Telopea speciosissima]